jgi:hypothetical protein
MEVIIRLLNKLSISILLILLLFFVTDVCGQQRISEQKITLNENQKSVKQILQSITNQTEIRFSYNPQIINDSKITSIKISNANISNVLKLLFEDTISFKQVSNYVILSKNNTQKMENTITRLNENKTTVQNPKPNLPQEENQIIVPKDNSIVSQEENSIIFQEDKTTDNQNFASSILIKEGKNQQANIGSDSSDCHSLNNNNDDMNKHLATLLVASALLAADTLFAQQTTQNDSNTRSVETTGKTEKSIPVQFSLVYPLGTSWVNSAHNQYNFSLSLIGGVTGKIKGVELAPVFNVNLKGVKGAQFAAGFNIASVAYRKDAEIADYESKNVQFATIFNLTRLGTSTQFAAGFNIADKAPFQASAIGNIAKQAPVQMTAGFNITQNSKLQISAIANIAKHSVSVQMSSGINYAQKSAVQMAAIVNVSDTAKVQISAVGNISRESKFQLSVVNVTKKGKVQIGIVNVRDTADGVSIGLINIVRKGGVMEAGIEFGEFITAAATFRSGIRPFYSILSVGYNASFGNDDWGNNMLVIGAGFGSTIRLHKKMDLNLELINYNIITNNLPVSEYYPTEVFLQLRTVFNYTFNRHLKLFVGPTFNLFYQYYTIKFGYGDYKFYATPSYSFASKNDGFKQTNFWIGGTIGLKF